MYTIYISIISAETNIHMYSNTKRVFGCTMNDFPAYFVINYKFKDILNYILA